MYCAGAFVNVGWGKKETQFHGSEGKPGAKTTDDQVWGYYDLHSVICVDVLSV